MAKRSPRRSIVHRVDGNGPDGAWALNPTAGQIRAALDGVPDDAQVRIKLHEWLWPKYAWTVLAWWERREARTEDERLEDRETFLRSKVVGA